MSLRDSVLVVHPSGDARGWRDALAQELPQFKLEVWPEFEDPKSVKAIVCWNQPSGIFATFSELKIIASLGAGIDHIQADPSLPPEIKIARVLTPRMVREMVRYVVHAALDHSLERATARNSQHAVMWERSIGATQHSQSITILGAGTLGLACADALRNLGFPVRLWTRGNSVRQSDLEIYSGWDTINQAVESASILVCLLPLTKETTGLINRSILASLAPRAAVINVGRGKQIIEEDLKVALESGLAGAYLDVWEPEPPPAESWIWRHPRVHLTPHIAAKTDRAEAARDIAAQIRTCLNN